jgi:hypothetical protein
LWALKAEVGWYTRARGGGRDGRGQLLAGGDAVGDELVAHGAHDGVDGVEAGVASGGEGFLETLAADADFGGHGGDALDAGDDAQGGEEGGGVAVGGVVGEDFGEEGVDFVGFWVKYSTVTSSRVRSLVMGEV